MSQETSKITGTASTNEAKRQLLWEMLHEHIAGKPFSELFSVTLDHRVQGVVGETVLGALADHGITADAFDAVGALTAAAVPIVASVIATAREHGNLLDGFIMDFVYPSIKGPSIAGRRVVLLDSWLSEKSYIQTSSLVTLHNGNELNLDFGIVSHERAEVVAIASLIGDADATRLDSGASTETTGTETAGTETTGESGVTVATGKPDVAGPIDQSARAETLDPTSSASTTKTPYITVVNPVGGQRLDIPFVEVFDERALRSEGGR